MDATKIIEALDGPSRVAELCGVTPGAVSQWKHNGIPKPWMKYFQAIRPDLFKPSRRSKVVPK
jgi:transcriptional regulator with XRE-family HTH domain